MKLLLLHGIGGGAAIWRDTLPALAGHDAQAIDFPGYGGAPGLPTLDAMVEAVLAHAPAGRRPGSSHGIVLIGHSMGGIVAQEVAARHPQAVQALVLACTSPSFGRADGAWQQRFVGERLAPLDAGLGMAGMALRVVPGLVSAGAVAGAAEFATDVMSRVPEATYRVALRAIAAFDRREALHAIAVPTLCLAAEHDRTAPPDVLRRMAERIPGARYACLADAGHIANVEQPAAFNAALLSFLETLPCTSPATRAR